MEEKYTREQKLNAIKRWAKKHNRVPTQREWLKSNAKPSVSCFYRDFGCWKKTLKAAGFKPVNSHKDRIQRKGRNKPHVTRNSYIRPQTVIDIYKREAPDLAMSLGLL